MTIGSLRSLMMSSFSNHRGRSAAGARPTWSEALLERPQIDLMRPGRSRLAVELPIGFGDRLDPEQTVLTAFFDDLRPSLAQAVAVDAAVDHHMRDMHAVRPIFPCHALGDRPQPRLGGREMR